MSTEFEHRQVNEDQTAGGPEDEQAGIEYYPQPAGFWIRVAASMLDTLVFLPVIAVFMYNMVTWKSVLISIFLVWLPGVLYKPLMEAHWGATLGKMACRLFVVDHGGHLLTVQMAYVRFLPFLVVRLLSLASMLVMFRMPEFVGARTLEQITELQAPSFVDHLQLPLIGFVLCDCLAVAVTDGKRAIHDFMAGSYCVMSSSWRYDEDTKDSETVAD